MDSPNRRRCNSTFIFRRLFAWARDEIFKDILRIKVEGILRQEARKSAENIPLFSAENMKTISDSIDVWLKGHPDISDSDFTNVMAIFPLALIAISPKFTPENLKLLFDIVLEVVQDHGGMLKPRRR